MKWVDRSAFQLGGTAPHFGDWLSEDCNCKPGWLSGVSSSARLPVIYRQAACQHLLTAGHTRCLCVSAQRRRAVNYFLPTALHSEISRNLGDFRGWRQLEFVLTFAGRQSRLWLANVFCLYLIKSRDKEKFQNGFKVYFCVLKKMEFHHLLTALIQPLAVVPSDNVWTVNLNLWRTIIVIQVISKLSHFYIEFVKLSKRRGEETKNRKLRFSFISSELFESGRVGFRGGSWKRGEVGQPAVGK